ncbi:MAG: toll/interleukin-1 receptor domain-containing protein [Acidobacteriota bacterium]|nr:toll/interleukin-1 receptor domain-containing protein [Acidobacteriota bacterium]
MKKNAIPPRKLRVFLCHSSDDKPLVRNLYNRLNSDGIDSWLDEENLLPGEEWELEIIKAVRSSDIVIVCLSQSSINKSGYVQKEIKLALDVADEQPEGAIFLIPVKLEECDVPRRLSRWHWVNLFQEHGYERLMRALKSRADKLGLVAGVGAIDLTSHPNILSYRIIAGQLIDDVINKLKVIPARGVESADSDELSRVNLYKAFTDNRKINPQIAYDAAQDYLKKYETDNDQYVTYLQKWVASYNKEARKLVLPQLIYNDKNFAEGFNIGEQILIDDPENLRALIDLGYGGYLSVAVSKNESYNATALAYAKKAIQLIESGKVPESEAPQIWLPFKSKEDTLAYLYFAVGVFNLKNNPNEAIPALIKAASFDSDIKKSPSTYYLLATAYETGPYVEMSTNFEANFEGKAESNASHLALAKLNHVLDNAIDSYARAINVAANDPKNAANRADWQKRLTDLYKFRHNNSDANLDKYIASVMSKPMPQPIQE